MIRRTLPMLALLVALPAAAHGDRDHAPAKPAKPAAPAQAKPAPAAGHAPGDHEHASPHGGQIIDVAKGLHAEVVFGDAGVSVFFYDGDMQQLPPPAEGKLTLVVGKGTQKLPLAVAALPAQPDHLFAAATLPPDAKVVALVQATVAGKPRTLRAERARAAPPAPATPTTTTTPTK